MALPLSESNAKEVPGVPRKVGGKEGGVRAARSASEKITGRD